VFQIVKFTEMAMGTNIECLEYTTAVKTIQQEIYSKQLDLAFTFRIFKGLSMGR